MIRLVMFSGPRSEEIVLNVDAVTSIVESDHSGGYLSRIMVSEGENSRTYQVRGRPSEVLQQIRDALS